MKPFVHVESIAACLDEDSVDTDIIFPARFLLLMDKVGLAKYAFHERRHAEGAESPFILDTPPFDAAQIFVGGKNFGTGSSREQAVWALADFGIRCVIAESFGEIFYSNCFKNGILPVVMSGEELTAIRSEARRGRSLVVDLPSRQVRLPEGRAISFDIESHRKDALLSGLDEIGSILRYDGQEIGAFEAQQKSRAPWLYLRPSQMAHFNDLEPEKALE